MTSAARTERADRLKDAWMAGRLNDFFACQRKVRYQTRRNAERVQRTPEGWRLHVYACDCCGGWHVTKRFQA